MYVFFLSLQQRPSLQPEALLAASGTAPGAPVCQALLARAMWCVWRASTA